LLYLVATPIGNLSDITYRAIETLKTCDYILCEDTRHSKGLLTHYDIQKPLRSFHKFSESSQEKGIIHDLQAGKTIGLISDAGTPGISDPGSALVKECRSQAIPVIAIPGACAAITAVSSSGLNTDRFQFVGFLPRKQNERRHFLQELLQYPGTTVCYESPNRLVDSLTSLLELAPKRKIVVARELTKKFEEVLQGTAEELIAHWRDQAVRGEIVLMISESEEEVLSGSEWEKLSPDEHVSLMEQSYHMTRNEAIKMVAQIRGVPKRTIYNASLTNKN